MDLMEAMKERHSVRQYTDQTLDEEVIRLLTEEIDACNQESGLHIQLVKNEPKAFDGFMAHYGKFSGVTNYIAMVGKKGPALEETCGYYGERLVLKAQQLGLNTCWVAMTYSKVKSAYSVDAGEKLCIVISLGYGKNQGVPHKSKSVDQVAKADGPIRRGSFPSCPNSHEPAEISVHTEWKDRICPGRNGILFQNRPGYRQISL